MKPLLFTLLLLAGTLFSQEPAEHSLSLETETGTLKGTLLLPAAQEKIPIVLIIAGSGPTDRNGNNPMMTNNSLKMLAEGLLEQGIASLRYDKRGVGESKGAGADESDLRFEHYVEDAIGWVAFLEKDHRFTEIIILGHSEGSLVGMIAARQKGVDKFISLAGSGVPAGDLLREQLKAQPPSILAQSLPIIEKLENGEKEGTVPEVIFPLFRPSVQPYMISWFKYDPRKEIAKIDKPVLIVQGTTDIQISVLDAERLSEANEKAEKHIVKGMNHILKEAEADRLKNMLTYVDPNLPLHTGLLNIIVAFVQKEAF